MPKFLNRLLSLQTGAMDAVFDSWYGYLEEATEAAREAGTLDVGVETIRAERVVKTDERLVYTHAAVGGDDAGRDAGAHAADGDRGLGRGLAPGAGGAGARVLGRVRRQPPERAGLRALPGREPDDGDRPRRAAPPPGRRPLEPAHGRDRDRAERGRGPRTVRRATDPFRPTRPGRSGRRESQAAPEFYTEPVHLVTGTILPIWDRIAGHPRIYRAQTTDRTGAASA